MSLRTASGALLIVGALLGGVARSQGGMDEGVKFALLVGVQQYEQNELRALKYADADVVELSVVLRDAGFKGRNVVILSESRTLYSDQFAPRRSNIVRELERLFARCTPKDSIVIALAGHGLQFKGSTDSYFCPSDAKVGDRESLISLDDLYKSLEKCPAHSKLLLVDACRNELVASTRARQTVDLESITRPRTKVPPVGTAAFFSCSATQVAYESDALKHGVFFNYVIEGLKGGADLDKDQEVTLPELELFVKGRTSQHVRRELGGAEQMPDLSNHTRGLMQIAKWDRLKEGYWDFQIDDLCNVPFPKNVALPRSPIVTGVSRGGECDKAGLKRGDVILTIDGQTIRCSTHLIEIERSRQPGSMPAVKVLRDGNEIVLKLPIRALEDAAASAADARRQAESGESWAMLMVGDHYFDGRGVAQSYAEAMKWFQKAAEAGHLRAWHRLADAHTHGKGREKNARLEADCYRQAANVGEPLGQLYLARALFAGRGVPRDEAEGLRLLKLAAERRLPAAQHQLGMMYATGDRVPQDSKEAVRLITLAAEEEYQYSELQLGEYYVRGKMGLEKDLKEGRKWLQRATEHGNRVAWAGLILIARTEGNEQDVVRFARRAAELDDRLAQVYLAEALENGLGVSADLDEAVKWYRISADRNEPRAQAHLGRLYSRGLGVPQRPAEAIAWWEKAAKQGNAEALYRLGLELRSGLNVEKDEAKGLQFLKDAAAKGNSDADAEVKKLSGTPVANPSTDFQTNPFEPQLNSVDVFKNFKPREPTLKPQ